MLNSLFALKAPEAVAQIIDDAHAAHQESHRVQVGYIGKAQAGDIEAAIQGLLRESSLKDG